MIPRVVLVSSEPGEEPTPRRPLDPNRDLNREWILCAAIYVDTGKAEPARRSSPYPATGLVFAGWRHADCFVLLDAWSARLTPAEKAEIETVRAHQLHGRVQGFLTSAGRFVDREAAWKIALEAGQVDPKGSPGKGTLTSEDLY